MRAKGESAPAWKIAEVDQIAATLAKYPVIAIAPLTNLPSRQQQSLRKALRGKAEIIVTKTAIAERAFKKAGKGSQLMPLIKGPAAIIATTMNPFELAAFCRKNKAMVAAKPGQTAPKDIIVPAGDTDLPPGPALSELKTAGINAQIKAGKISVAKDSQVAKAGDRITLSVAKALVTLGVKPIEIRMWIDGALEGGTVYAKDVLEIDEAKVMADFAADNAAALSLSISIAWPTRKNAATLIGLAAAHARSLALSADLYEPDVIANILAKAEAQAAALKSQVKTEG